MVVVDAMSSASIMNSKMDSSLLSVNRSKLMKLAEGIKTKKKPNHKKSINFKKDPGYTNIEHLVFGSYKPRGSPLHVTASSGTVTTTTAAALTTIPNGHLNGLNGSSLPSVTNELKPIDSSPSSDDGPVVQQHRNAVYRSQSFHDHYKDDVEEIVPSPHPWNGSCRTSADQGNRYHLDEGLLPSGYGLGCNGTNDQVGPWPSECLPGRMVSSPLAMASMRDDQPMKRNLPPDDRGKALPPPDIMVLHDAESAARSETPTSTCCSAGKSSSTRSRHGSSKLCPPMSPNKDCSSTTLVTPSTVSDSRDHHHHHQTGYIVLNGSQSSLNQQGLTAFECTSPLIDQSLLESTKDRSLASTVTKSDKKLATGDRTMAMKGRCSLRATVGNGSGKGTSGSLALQRQSVRERSSNSGIGVGQRTSNRLSGSFGYGGHRAESVASLRSSSMQSASVQALRKISVSSTNPSNPSLSTKVKVLMTTDAASSSVISSPSDDKSQSEEAFVENDQGRPRSEYGTSFSGPRKSSLYSSKSRSNSRTSLVAVANGNKTSGVTSAQQSCGTQSNARSVRPKGVSTSSVAHSRSQGRSAVTSSAATNKNKSESSSLHGSQVSLNVSSTSHRTGISNDDCVVRRSFHVANYQRSFSANASGGGGRPTTSSHSPNTIPKNSAGRMSLRLQATGNTANSKPPLYPFKISSASGRPSGRNAASGAVTTSGKIQPKNNALRNSVCRIPHYKYGKNCLRDADAPIKQSDDSNTAGQCGGHSINDNQAGDDRAVVSSTVVDLGDVVASDKSGVEQDVLLEEESLAEQSPVVLVVTRNESNDVASASSVPPCDGSDVVSDELDDVVVVEEDESVDLLAGVSYGPHQRAASLPKSYFLSPPNRVAVAGGNVAKSPSPVRSSSTAGFFRDVCDSMEKVMSPVEFAARHTDSPKVSLDVDAGEVDSRELTEDVVVVAGEEVNNGNDEEEVNSPPPLRPPDEPVLLTSGVDAEEVASEADGVTSVLGQQLLGDDGNCLDENVTDPTTTTLESYDHDGAAAGGGQGGVISCVDYKTPLGKPPTVAERSIPKCVRRIKAASSPVFTESRVDAWVSEGDLRRPWSQICSDQDVERLVQAKSCALDSGSMSIGIDTIIHVHPATPISSLPSSTVMKVAVPGEESTQGNNNNLFSRFSSMRHPSARVAAAAAVANTPVEGVLQKFRKSFSARFYKKAKNGDSPTTSVPASNSCRHASFSAFTDVRRDQEAAFLQSEDSRSCNGSESGYNGSLFNQSSVSDVSAADSSDGGGVGVGGETLFRLGPIVWRSSKERKEKLKKKKKKKDPKCENCNVVSDFNGLAETCNDRPESSPTVASKPHSISSTPLPSVRSRLNVYPACVTISPKILRHRAKSSSLRFEKAKRPLSDQDAFYSSTVISNNHDGVELPPFMVAIRSDKAAPVLRWSKGGRSNLRRSVSQPLEIEKLEVLGSVNHVAGGLSDQEDLNHDLSTTSSDEEICSDMENDYANGSAAHGVCRHHRIQFLEPVVYAEALWDHVTMDAEELAFKAGDLIEVFDDNNSEWWWGVIGNSAGWFPASFVRLRVNQEDTVEDCVAKMGNGTLSSQLNRKTSVSLLSNDQVRTNVIMEIISTEKDFVSHLKDVCEGYLKQVRKRPDMFPDDRICIIFGNIEQLYAFQSEFVSKLEQCINWDQPHLSQIGSCFTEHREGFEMYSEYCNNHPQSVSELQELYANTKYAHFFEACRLLQDMIDISLDGFLLTPVQKICKYPLQLAELLKYTKSDHPDHEQVAEALETMRSVAQYINERKRRMECLEKLAAWQMTLEYWEGPDLLDVSSELIYSGDVSKVTTAWSRDFTLFLFDHQVIVCKKDLLKRNTYSYKSRINLDACEVVDIPDGKDTSTGLTLKNAWKMFCSERGKWLIFAARNAEEKTRWLKEFSRERWRVEDDQQNGFVVTEKAKKTAMMVVLNRKNAKRPKGKESKSMNRRNARPNVFVKSKSGSLPSNLLLSTNKKKTTSGWFHFGSNKKAKR